MILYQLAKRLEKREKLQRSIQLSEGSDTASLLSMKADLDGELQAQAHAWNENGGEGFILPETTPDLDGWQQNHTLG